jgi:hypothetical protein
MQKQNSKMSTSKNGILVLNVKMQDQFSMPRNCAEFLTRVTWIQGRLRAVLDVTPVHFTFL